jgi:UDP-N-acetylmuramoylalanine--D-glutamate ligase
VSRRFAGERVVVIGAGVAGASAATVLRAGGADVLVTDVRDDADLDLAAIAGSGARVETGGHRPEQLDGATLVVVSPGVPPSAEVLAWARQRGLPIWGELELGARVATATYLAVTGTNGKTTTTGMLTAMLMADGRDAVACGNIGHPFPVAATEGHDLLVVEVSSFQLEHQTSFHPTVSVLLNLAPDHLDAHGSFDAYAASKAKIIAAAAADDVHVGNRDDAAAAAISSTAVCRRVWFRRDAPEPDEAGYEGDELVTRIGPVARLGAVSGPAGYRADAAAAAAAALAFGAAPEAVRAGLAAFRSPAHRGEEVARVDGVRFLDDSKATNVHAARAAIAGVRDAVLIAGGRAKGQDLSPLADDASHLRAVVAVGESAAAVERAFAGHVPVHRAEGIEEATREAFALAGPGGTVLLAPACASWDAFRDYAERGDRFAAAARALGERDG